ncbi:MAG: IS1595 family transposase [Planctomycetota bacterium]
MDTKTLAELGALTEEEARTYLESLRWPNGPVCHRCGSMSAFKFQGKSTRPGLYKCNGCRKPFSVTTGTVMERSHISLRHWIMAFHLICSSKKGISAHQLMRNLGLKSYRSAWHLAHRIRFAMTSEPLASLLSGVVEVDESYFGGRPRNPIREGTPGKSNRGAGTRKTPVMVLVERDGKARAFPIQRINSDTLKGAIRENVARSATIMTDEGTSYRGIGAEFAGGHFTTNHLAREYAKPDGKGGLINSNTAESFFALMKRGVHGVFHHVSKKHLPRYCNEFSFRWDHRKGTDSERTEAAIRGAEGKRLMYSATKSQA